MPGLRKAYAALAREATDDGHSMVRFLSACLTEELESRKQSRHQQTALFISIRNELE